MQPSLDHQRLEQYLVYIAEQVDSVAERVQSDAEVEELRRDPLAMDGVVYRLQTAIQAMIDVAYQLCAHAFSTAPDGAAHAFELLRQHGLLSEEMLQETRRMSRFRNLVVHGYLRRDDAIVMEIARNHLEDFRTFIREVRSYLEGEAATE